MADIKRNLQEGGGMYINKWVTGLYDQRSPLFVPVSAMGLQLISRFDTLWDGVNTDISRTMTLIRRPGFTRYSSVALGAEHPLSFYSFKNTTGVIKALVDTNTRVAWFDDTSITTVCTKTATTQANFQKVADTVYFCTGNDADSKKWDGTTATKWGIDPPSTTPTLTFAAGSLSPMFGYKYVYVYKNSKTGHISTASDVSADTGSMKQYQTVETVAVPVAPYKYTITHAASLISDDGVKYASSSTALAVAGGLTPNPGEYLASAGVYTFNATDVGKSVSITYTYALSTSTGVNITVHGDLSTDAQVDKIDIYRNRDGGSLFYYLATVNNTALWTYTDSTVDDDLNDDLVAPLAKSNNPPPAGINLACFYLGRMWVASGTKLYFGAGPDCINGVPEESFPPANVFTLPAVITALVPTSQGLAVFTQDDAFAILGTDLLSFTPKLWQANFGVQNQNCVVQDGDMLFVYTSNRQLFQFAGSLTEIGFPIQARLGAFTPANVRLALHRSGADEGLFVSDGSSTIYRYSVGMGCWSTAYQPVGGCGCIKSIEVATSDYRLMVGRSTPAGYLLSRNPNSYNDDGSTYSAYAIVGSLILAPPRQVATIQSVLLETLPVGTYPTVSVLLNEISGIFAPLPYPVPDPPQLLASTTVKMMRHDLKASQTPLPQHVRHMQVKVTFIAEDARNEIIGLALA